MGQKYIETTKEKIKPEGLKKSRLVVDGDFILSNSMSFGRPYIVKTTGAIHDGWLVFRDVDNNLDKDFFYYLLSSSYVYQQFSRNASGSTVRNLNIDIVKQTNISLPPLNEQKRIVAKIEKLFSNLDNSDKYLLHLEKQLKRYKQSVLKSAFEGEYKKIQWNEVTNIINGKHYTDVVNENGKYPIYGSAGIINYADEYLCNEDTVIVGRKGTINKPLFVKKKFWNIDTAFGIEANKERLAPMYLYYFSLSFNFLELNQSTTIPSLTKSNLLKINMPLPDTLDEQQEIVNQIEKHFSIIDKLETVV